MSIMLLSERQKLILFAAIHEYIKRAEPVSSQSLAEAYHFDIGSATLRNELSLLEEYGYLFQPHTSAGRIPTDAGYRLFVNAVTQRHKKEKERMKGMLIEIARLKREEDARFAELARMIAAFSGNAVFSGPLGSRALFKAGLNEVLSQPELDDFEVRKHFGRVLDSFEENFGEFSETLEDRNPIVFIGRENPMNNARDFSMIVSRCRLFSDDGVVVIFGPKRMDYEKNLSVLSALAQLFD